MKPILILALPFSILFSCSPAVESRESMDSVAKRTSDSLDRCLDSALNDPTKEFASPTPSVTTLAPIKTSSEEAQ